MESIQRLLKVAAAVEQAADHDTANWFQSGLAAYLTGDETRSLDTLLGLTSQGVGRLSPKRDYLKKQRDLFLRRAFELTDLGKPNTRRCEELAGMVKDFESRIWPAWRTMDGPPAGSSELRRLLFLAKRTGEPLPTQWRTVWRAVFDF